MKRYVKAFLCTFLAVFLGLSLSGCKKNKDVSGGIPETASTVSTSTVSVGGTETASQTSETEFTGTETVTGTEPSEATGEAVQQTSETEPSETAAPPETTSVKTEKTTVTETTAEKPSIEKDGSYTTPEDVAEYIHTFGTLPDNFITKDEAKELGWDNKKGNLWDVAEGKSIGGDRFGNYEGLLPKAKGRKYTECDVNYEGGYRGGERIIFSNDGLIYYTDDHYQTFTQLY